MMAFEQDASILEVEDQTAMFNQMGDALPEEIITQRDKALARLR